MAAKQHRIRKKCLGISLVRLESEDGATLQLKCDRESFGIIEVKSQGVFSGWEIFDGAIFPLDRMTDRVARNRSGVVF